MKSNLLRDETPFWRRRRTRVRLGQVVMLIGAAVAAVHWLAHLGAFGDEQPPGWVDLVAGYPAGAVLVVIGAVIASSAPKPKSASEGAKEGRG
ncbi:MAG: hypothetical protein HY996_07420 [Micrococcales bacterium]|nr:hypothetical protein [Micrococcales bacterium]